MQFIFILKDWSKFAAYTKPQEISGAIFLSIKNVIYIKWGSKR